MKKIIMLSAITIFVSIIVITVNPSMIFSSENGPSAGFCGAPSDGGTNCTNCHNTYSAITSAGWITSNIPASGYVPGSTYTITATATYSGLVKFGFQISPQNASGTKLGTLVITDATNTQLIGSSKYVEHKLAGTTGTTGFHTWNFNWIAPAAGSGPVTFYGAFNCSNNNSSSSGDHIVLSTTSVTEHTCNLTANINNTGNILCPADSTTLVASGANNFLWSNGATASTIHVPAGTYAVTVNDGTGCTASSNITLINPDCPVPTGIVTSNVFGTKATVSWTTVACALQYQLLIRKVGTTAWTTFNVLSPATSKIITGLIPLTSYEFQLRSNCNGSTNSSYSAIQTFTTLCDCGKPTSVTVSGINSTGVTFNWIGNSCAVKYRIQYRVNGTATWITAIINAPSLTKTFTTLTANTTYQYRMRSDCNSVGTFNSGWTTISSFTTAPRLEGNESGEHESSFYVSPNPNNGEFIIHVRSNSDDIASFRIFTLDGKEVATKFIELSNGENEQMISVENIPEGIYLIEFSTSQYAAHQKVEVIR